MITPVYNRTDSDSRTTYVDINRICANVNEICGGNLRTNWTQNDIVDNITWNTIVQKVKALDRYEITYDGDFINLNNIERSLFEQYDETHHITADAKLTGLAISNAQLSPLFNPTTYQYTATVNAPTSIAVAESDYSAITYMLNGEVVDPEHIEWEYGQNTLRVTATLNGNTVAYIVQVTSTYQRAELLTLSIDGNNIPVADYMNYFTVEPSGVIDITATGEVEITLNGEEADELNWIEGTNILQIKVTASDAKTYTVAVESAYEAPQPATLIGINLSNTLMTPPFSPDVLTYNAYPEAEEISIDVIEDEDVTFTIYRNGTEIEDGSSFEWNEGDTITVVTDATEDMTSRTYTVNIGAAETTPLGPLHSGEIIAGDALIGEANAV